MQPQVSGTLCAQVVFSLVIFAVFKSKKIEYVDILHGVVG